MAQKVLVPPPIIQLEDEEGRPAAGYKMFIYAAGTTTKVQTFTDASGLTPNTNPIIGDAEGYFRVWTRGLEPEPVDALPPGPPGPQGPAGPAGPSGSQGAPGLSNFPMVTTDISTSRIMTLNDVPLEILPLPPINYYYCTVIVVLQSSIVGLGFDTSGNLSLRYGDETGLPVWNVDPYLGAVLMQSENAVDAPATRLMSGSGFGDGTPTWVPLLSVAGQRVTLSAPAQWISNQDPGPINKIVISDGGTGYAVDDVGDITGGDNGATYKVLAVSGGVVTEIELVDVGDTYDNDTSVVTIATTGVGVGLELDVYVIEGNDSRLRVSAYYQFGVVQQLSGAITSSLKAALGTGYVVGDTFTVTGGDGNATGMIEQIGVGGAVDVYHLTYQGSGYSIAPTAATTSGGAGTGFTLQILAVAL